MEDDLKQQSRRRCEETNGKITEVAYVFPSYPVLSAVFTVVRNISVVINCTALNWEARSGNLRAT